MSDLSYTVEVNGTEEVNKLATAINRVTKALDSDKDVARKLASFKKAMGGISGASADFQKFGTELASLKATFTESMGVLASIAKKEMQELRAALKTGAIGSKAAGQDIGDGVADGLNSSTDKAVKAAKNMAAKVKAEVTKAYDKAMGYKPNLAANTSDEKQLLHDFKISGASLTPYHAAVVKQWLKSSDQAAIDIRQINMTAAQKHIDDATNAYKKQTEGKVNLAGVDLLQLKALREQGARLSNLHAKELTAWVKKEARSVSEQAIETATGEYKKLTEGRVALAGLDMLQLKALKAQGARMTGPHKQELLDWIKREAMIVSEQTAKTATDTYRSAFANKGSLQGLEHADILQLKALREQGARLSNLHAKELTAWVKKEAQTVAAGIKQEAQKLYDSLSKGDTRAAISMDTLFKLKLNRAEMSQFHRDMVSKWAKDNKWMADAIRADNTKTIAQLRAEGARISDADLMRFRQKGSQLGMTPSTIGGAFTPYDAAGKQAAELKRLNQEAKAAEAAAGSLGAGMRRLTIDGNSVHSMARGLASGFNLLWLTWGKLAPLFAGASISFGLKKTFDIGSEVEYSIKMMEMLGMATKEQGVAVRQALRDIDQTTQFSLVELSQGMVTLGQAGKDLRESLDIIKPAADLASLGMTDLNSSINLLNQTQNLFGRTSADAAKTAAQLFEITKSAPFTIQDLAGSMKYASETNTRFGVSLEETLVLLGSLAKSGLKAQSGGTALINLLRDVYGRSGPAEKALRQLGEAAGKTIETFDESGKQRPFLSILKDIQEAAKLMSSVDADKILGTLTSDRGGRAYFATMRSDVEALQKQAEELGKTSTEKFAQSAMGLMDTTKGAVDLLQGALVGSLDKVFEAHSTKFKSFIVDITKVVDSKEFLHTVYGMVDVVGVLYEKVKSVMPVLQAFGAIWLTFKAASMGVAVFQTVAAILGGMAPMLAMTTRQVAATTGAMLTSTAAWSANGTAMMGNAAAARAAAAGGDAAAISQARVAGAALGTSGALLGEAAAAKAAAAGLDATAQASARADAAATGARVGMRGLAVVMGFLMNPIVGIITTLGLLGLAFWSTKTDAESAMSGTTKAIQANGQLNIDQWNKEIAKLRERNLHMGDSFTQSEVDLQIVKGNLAKKTSDAEKILKRIEDAAAREGDNYVSPQRKQLIQWYMKYVDESKAMQTQINQATDSIETGRAKSLQDQAERQRQQALAQDKAIKDALGRSSGVKIPDAGGGKPGAGGKPFIDRADLENTAKLIEQEFNRETQLYSKKMANELAIAKDYHEMGRTSKVEFAKQEFDIIAEYTKKQEALSESSLKKRAEAYEAQVLDIQAAHARTLAGNKGKKGAEGANAASERSATKGIEDATRDYLAFAEAVKDKNDAFDSEKQKREVASLKELAGQVKKNTEAFAEYKRTRELGIQQKEVEKETEEALRWANPAQAAEINAVAAATKKYFDELSKFQATAEEAQIVLNDTAKLFGADSKQFEVASASFVVASNNVEQVIANGRKDIQEASIDSLAKYYADSMTSSYKAAADSLAELLKQSGQLSFANAVTSLNQLVNAFDGLISQQEHFNKLKADPKNDPAKIAKMEASAQVKSYADITKAAKGFFKESSTGYKILHNTEKAFRAYEMAIAIENTLRKIGLIGSEVAAGTAAEGEKTSASNAGVLARLPSQIVGIFASFMSMMGPYGAAAAGIAIAALGIGAYNGRKADPLPDTATGTGTVFGDKDAKSESINKALELLGDVNTLTMKYSAEMSKSLRNIENSIGGVTNIILRSNGMQDSLDKVDLTSTKDFGFLSVFKPLIGIYENVPVLGKILGKVNDKLFGTTTKVIGQGIYTDDVNYSQMKSGDFSAGYYTEVERKKKILGVTSKPTKDILKDPNSEISDQFSKILMGFVELVNSAGPALGVGVDKIDENLNGFILKIGRIDLKDLKGDEIKEKILAVFGAAGDDIARAAIPGLDKFQKVGEGYLETLVRVANTTEAVRVQFEALGHSIFNSVDSAMAMSDAFGGVDKMMESTAAYFDAFYSEEEKSAVTMGRFTDMFARLGVEAPKTAEEYRALVDSQLALSSSTEQANVAMSQLTGGIISGSIEAIAGGRSLNEMGMAFIQGFAGAAEASSQAYNSAEALESLKETARDAAVELMNAGPAFAEYQANIKSINEALLSDVGISAETISTTFRDVILGREDAIVAGEALADMVTGGVYNAIAGSFAQQLTDLMVDTIITPVIQAAATGSSISEAVSQNAIDNMVEQAQRAAEALGQILNDPALKVAIDSVSMVIRNSLGAASSGNYIKPYTPTYAATSSTSEVKDTWKDLMSTIVQQTQDAIRSLADIGKTSYELAVQSIHDKAKKSTEDLIAKGYGRVEPQDLTRKKLERERAQARLNAYSSQPTSDYKKQQMAVQQAIIDSTTVSIEALTTAISGYPPQVQALVDAEKSLLDARNAATAKTTLDKLATEVNRLNFTDMQKTLAGIDDQTTDYIKGLKDIGQATAGNTMAVYAWSDAMKNAAQKAETLTNATNSTDKAYEALQRAVEAERKTLNTQLEAARKLADETSSIFDTLKSAVDDLYNSVEVTAKFSMESGKAFIRNALSGALATGSLPDGKELSEAISAARTGMDNKQYTSQFEADKDRLVLAGQLDEMKAVAGKQKTLAEQQVEFLELQLVTLDKTLEKTKEQIDLIRGVDVSVIRVEAAIDRLGVAMAAEAAARAAAEAAARAAAEAAARAAAEAAARAAAAKPAAGGGGGGGGGYSLSDIYERNFGWSPDAEGAQFWTDSGLSGAALEASIIEAGKAYDIDAMRAEKGLPKLAVGTDYVPQDMIAQIHKGEQIIPKAYNPHANGNKNDNAELVAEIRALREEVKSLKSEVADGNQNTKQLADQFDSVSAGGNALATEVM